MNYSIFARYLQYQFYRFSQRLQARYRRFYNTAGRALRFALILLSGDQIQLAVIIFLITVTVGTLGYSILWGWGTVDAFYMTMISLTTVGFGEIRPLNNEGRIFTVLLILAGVSIFAYGISGAVDEIISGRVIAKLTGQRRGNVLEELRNHYIIAGFGRVGKEIALAFKHENIPFLVIDHEEMSISDANELGYLALLGNASEDEILNLAHIDHARGLIAAAGDDATNIYIVLSARGLNTTLQIIARASDVNAEPKMIRAGADHAISPYVLSGRRMAGLALRPHVIDFLDLTAQSDKLDQMLEEVVVEENSVIANKTVREIDLRRRTGANILAIYRPNRELVSNPSASTLLEPGTRLILLGTRDQLQVTEALSRNFLQLIHSGEES